MPVSAECPPAGCRGQRGRQLTRAQRGEVGLEDAHDDVLVVATQQLRPVVEGGIETVWRLVVRDLGAASSGNQRHERVRRDDEDAADVDGRARGRQRVVNNRDHECDVPGPLATSIIRGAD